MKLLTAIQQRLGSKLFLSYLVIVIVGVVTLAGTAKFHAPAALLQHVAVMEALIGDNPALAIDLRDSFLAAVNEILTVAAVAASLAALITSSFVAQRIIDPIRQLMLASRRIAAGEFHERVQVSSEDELGALAQTFNRMATTLEQTEQRRLELIGDVAHELRTPLSGIKSIMEGLVDGVLPPEPATYIDVQREVARLQRLIHDLQELSHAEAGQIPLDLRSISPTKLIHIAADRLRPQFKDKNVSLHFDLYSEELARNSTTDLDIDRFAPFSHDAQTSTGSTSSTSSGQTSTGSTSSTSSGQTSTGTGVPEPSTLSLLGLTLVGSFLYRRRRSKAAA